ncbi:sulfite exporter TauE/SafE family protein [Burkholderiaceae bacterium DAT-1]|nr:sulfite exporter TauE/SafE family protein [Burkholderiaceae bacterium DAT-1]
MGLPETSWHIYMLVMLAGVYAGIQNTLAGGGSFITFPALMMAGLSPLSANMTSTVALFPGQITSALAGRSLAGGAAGLSVRQLTLISLAGGVAGAILLLSTPEQVFARLVPWLVLFATTVFAWGTFRKQSIHAAAHVSTPVIAVVQFCIAVYGGYFGGGIGILMLAALTIAGMQVRQAAATKNILAMVMNASAVLIFARSPLVDWLLVLALGTGGVMGGLAGGWLMHRVPEKALRIFVIGVGMTLTTWLFLK